MYFTIAICLQQLGSKSNTILANIFVRIGQNTFQFKFAILMDCKSCSATPKSYQATKLSITKNVRNLMGNQLIKWQFFMFFSRDLMLKNMENQSFMENSRGKKCFAIWYWSSRMGGFLSHDKFALRGTQKKTHGNKKWSNKFSSPMGIKIFPWDLKNVIYWYFRKPKFAQFHGTSENESSKTREK